MSTPRLVRLTEQVWSLDATLKMAPGVVLPIRATVLRDADGSVTVISPVEGVDAWAPEVEALGPVRRVVAPSGLHHLFALPAARRFADAELWAAAPLRDKRKDLPPTTRWLAGPGPVRLSDDLEGHLVAGMPNLDEWVWLHAPSRTLVVTDLLFHLLDPGWGLGHADRKSTRLNSSH